MEMMKVKEWGQKAGINLMNYDGFVDGYRSILQKESNSFSETVIDRFQSAGNLICGRKYFESNLSYCTININSEEEYKTMVDVIPNFVDLMINGSIMNRVYSLEKKYKDYNNKSLAKKISDLFRKNNQIVVDDEDVKNLDGLLKDLKIKQEARNKSIEYAQMDEVSCEVKLETNDIPNDKKIELKQYIGITEQEAFKELFSTLLEIKNNPRNHRITDIPFSLINAYSLLSYKRKKLVNSLSREEFGELYLIPNKYDEQENFVKTYSIISENGVDHGVAFKIADNDQILRGSMPISEERKNQIDENIDSFKRKK